MLGAAFDNIKNEIVNINVEGLKQEKKLINYLMSF